MSVVGVGAAELLILAAIFFGGGAGGALGGAPLPPDAGLQSAAPPDCFLYAAHNGLKSPDLKSPNHFEQLLAEPENQAFFAELNRLAEQALKLVPANDEPAKLLRTTMPTLLPALLERPSMLYVADVVAPPNAPSASAGLVIHGGDRTAALRDVVEQWERFYLTQIPPNHAVETLTIEGVSVRKLPFPPQVPPVVWGVSGEYLFLAVGENETANLLKRLQSRGPAPEWLSKLTQDVRIARPGDLLYFNFGKTFALAEPFLKQAAAAGAPFDVDQLIETLGVRQLHYVALASGLSEEAAVSKILIGREAGGKGIGSLLSGKPLGKDELAGIPKAADFALVTRLDGAALFDQIVDLVRQFDPRGFERFTTELEQAEEQIGFSPRRDLLDGLGDLWAIYNSPKEGGSLLTGACISVSVHDRAKLERVIEQLLRIAAAEANRGDKPEFALRKTLVGEQTITYVQFLKEPIPVAPAWCLTKDRLIVALSPQMVRAHLSRPAEAGSLADVDGVAKQLASGDVTSFTYADTTLGVQVLYSYLQYGVTMGASALEKQTGIQADLSKFPSFTAIGPHAQPSIGVVRSTDSVWSAESHATGPSIGPTAVIGVGMAMILPAVQAARETARINTARNNLRGIGTAAFNYEIRNGKPLPRAILSADGKPLLSWRVAILPDIDEAALYRQFHLDEPWDSDHNRKLIAKMPRIYEHPSIPGLRELGATPVQIPVGEGTLFGEGYVQKKPKSGEAVLFVFADRDQGVVWTKPEDLDVDPDSPFNSMLRSFGSQVDVILTDVSIRVVQVYADSQEERDLLKALFPNK